jgi:hypothetical protein
MPSEDGGVKQDTTALEWLVAMEVQYVRILNMDPLSGLGARVPTRYFMY